jgi:virulence-associated protein VagC
MGAADSPGERPMKTRVTDQGVVIPKDWLPGVEEVEVRREGGVIVLTPIPPADPLLGLGRRPVTVDVTDASVNHDHYLTEP